MRKIILKILRMLAISWLLINLLLVTLAVILTLVHEGFGGLISLLSWIEWLPIVITSAPAFLVLWLAKKLEKKQHPNSQG